MIEFEVHASGSGGNLYSVRDGDASLLIECGLPFRKIQEALDFTLSSYDACLISHSHMDHAKAVKDLMRAGVDCYASSKTWQKLGVSHRSKNLVPLEIKPIGPWLVLGFEVPHDEPGTLGFMVSGPSHQAVLYVTDLCYSPYKFSDCTILAVECNHSEAIIADRLASGDIDPDQAHRILRTHMSIERLLTLLKANDLSKVTAIHLLHLSSDNSHAEDFKRQVQSATGIPTYVADRGVF